MVPYLVTAEQGDAVLINAKGELSPDDRQIYRDFVESRLPILGLQRHELGRYWGSVCPTCGKMDLHSENVQAF